MYTPQLFRDSVYSDSLPLLKRLKELGYELGIFSEGVLANQLAKIQHTSIKKYTTRKYRFITADKRTEEYIATLPKDCVIIDDNVEIGDQVKRFREDILFIDVSTYKNRDNEQPKKLLAEVPEIKELIQKAQQK